MFDTCMFVGSQDTQFSSIYFSIYVYVFSMVLLDRTAGSVTGSRGEREGV